MAVIKITSYTQADVDALLTKIKQDIADDRFSISLNRQRSKNCAFRDTYGLKHKDFKKILQTIQVKDFCYATPNEHANFEDETLYVFALHINLCTILGEEKAENLYIKFNRIENENGFTIVVSIHPEEHPLTRLFA